MLAWAAICGSIAWLATTCVHNQWSVSGIVNADRLVTIFNALEVVSTGRYRFLAANAARFAWVHTRRLVAMRMALPVAVAGSHRLVAANVALAARGIHANRLLAIIMALPDLLVISCLFTANVARFARGAAPATVSRLYHVTSRVTLLPGQEAT
jgi:hypothetical protein